MEKAVDKRIVKTRKNIKETLIEVLQQTPFEKITVAELCRRGQTSRITFYTYYDNKYALINEMLADYIREADRDYHELQKMNNPTGDGLIGYENLLECILRLFYRNVRFFSHATPEENPYLFSAFFNHVVASVDDYLQRHTKLVAQYPTRETAALLCNGLLGVINVCSQEKRAPGELRRIVRAMYNDILTSNLFRKQEESV